MKHLSVTALVLASACLVASAGAAEPPPTPAAPGAIVQLQLPLDREMVARHAGFGYSDEELTRWFGQPRTLAFDTTGLARERIVPPPAPGIHPRVLFTAAGLPELRKRLAETVPGKLQMDAIRAVLAALLTGPKAKFAAQYAQAVAGTAGEDLREVEPACAIVYETFRCLIDDDAAGGRRAATALAALAVLDDAALDAAFAARDRKNANAKPPAAPVAAGAPTVMPPLRDFQETMGVTQCGLLALGYDFAYQWLTEEQRTAVRRALAKASANMTVIGAETLPALPANSSNWISMHLRLVFIAAAIEGEPGYDPATWRRCVSAYQNYLTVGMFPSGEMYEGMGKGFVLAEQVAPLMNHGVELLALKQVRAQVGDYYLHAMDPWGAAFTFYDSLGGRGNTTPMHDLIVMKHYFPADPAIDFVYRCTVGEDYGVYRQPLHFGHFFHLGDGLIRAIFAHEYDAGLSWEQARVRAVAGKPPTYFSQDTCNLITRSAWTPDALQLHVLTRAVAGGHQYTDRGHFSLHALGRYWSIYRPMRQVEEHYLADHRSVLLIDGKGTGMSPGRCVAMKDGADATAIAIDLTSTWAWQTGGNNRFPKGGQPVPFNGNFFRLTRSPLPWMDAPWSDLPNWQTSLKGSELWLPHLPVRHAFRTVGLVRGAHPYALVLDDVRKDEQPHEYRWHMQLEPDLVQHAASGMDLVLGERGPGERGLGEPGKSEQDGRFLLVRILDANGVEAGRPAVVEPYTVPNPPQAPIDLLRVVITARAVSPAYKMLLFPYRAGAEQPLTTWNADRTEVTIAWKDQRDTVRFTAGPDGRTRLAVARAGAVILDL